MCYITRLYQLTNPQYQSYGQLGHQRTEASDESFRLDRSTSSFFSNHILCCPSEVDGGFGSSALQLPKWARKPLRSCYDPWNRKRAGERHRRAGKSKGNKAGARSSTFAKGKGQSRKGAGAKHAGGKCRWRLLSHARRLYRDRGLQ